MQGIFTSRQDWCLISAELTDMDKAQKTTATAALRADLDSLGCRVIPCNGVYKGTVERSFLALGITEGDALRLGRKYRQESVMLPHGLVFCDGGESLPIAGIREGAHGDCYTSASVDGEETVFTIDLAA